MTATARPISWWNLLPLWRGLAGTGLVATLLLATMLLTQTAPVNPTTYLVVLVAPQNQAPGWVIQASNLREIQLIPLGLRKSQLTRHLNSGPKRTAGKVRYPLDWSNLGKRFLSPWIDCRRWNPTNSLS